MGNGRPLHISRGSGICRLKTSEVILPFEINATYFLWSIEICISSFKTIQLRHEQTGYLVRSALEFDMKCTYSNWTIVDRIIRSQSQRMWTDFAE